MICFGKENYCSRYFSEENDLIAREFLDSTLESAGIDPICRRFTRLARDSRKVVYCLEKLRTAILQAQGVDTTKAKALFTRYIKKNANPASMVACSIRGYVELAKLFKECGVSFGLVTEPSKFTLLHYAAQNGHRDFAKWLITNGLPLESQSVTKRTAMHYACQHGHGQLIAELVESGANLNHSDAKGNTPLHIVCFQASREQRPYHFARIMVFLHSKGAVPAVLNTDGVSPYRLFVESLAGDEGTSLRNLTNQEIHERFDRRLFSIVELEHGGSEESPPSYLEALPRNVREMLYRELGNLNSCLLVSKRWHNILVSDHIKLFIHASPLICETAVQ